MPSKSPVKKLLFIVNAGSGNDDEDYHTLINKFFDSKNVETDIYHLPKKIDQSALKNVIKKSTADRVIAIGGDGTVKLVAECLMGTDIPLGIIPGGSANGLAKELDISEKIPEAMSLTIEGRPHKIHLIKINGEICIHLADLGFNAFLVQKFDSLPGRGMWGYTKAAFHALTNHKRMEVELVFKGETVRSKAAMVAIANATRYGTGLKINPDGKLTDDLFEIILVKDYSYFEILKVWITGLPFNPEKVEVFQTKSLKITSKHNVHFQVDGEYLGKVKTITAEILPAALSVIAGPRFGENER